MSDNIYYVNLDYNESKLCFYGCCVIQIENSNVEGIVNKGLALSFQVLSFWLRFFKELLPPLSSLLTTFPPWNDKKGMSLRATEGCVAIPL